MMRAAGSAGAIGVAKDGICRRPIVFSETSRAVPVIESTRPVLWHDRIFGLRDQNIIRATPSASS